jgi:hypothetical protein
MNAGKIEIASRTIDRRALRLAEIRSFEVLQSRSSDSISSLLKINIVIGSFPASMQSYINL